MRCSSMSVAGTSRTEPPVDRQALTRRIEAALGGRVQKIEIVGGGHGATLCRVELAGRQAVAVKTAASMLTSEGRMLRDLAGRTPLRIPRVHYGDDTLLISDWIDNDGSALDRYGQESLADGLAVLHANSAERFGYAYDVMIGGMAQINEWQSDWRTLFIEKRLLSAGFLAHREGNLPPDVLRRLAMFCQRLDALVDEPERPALLHGDLWPGNVLTLNGRPAALIDPAIYYGHPEMDIAFSGLFGGFGRDFYRRYGERARLAPGFEERRDIWNLWPLLVHVYLFGGSYVGAVDAILRRHT